MFASILKRYRSELRADFQQYYALNLDYLGIDYGIVHAADLAVMLPPESRVMRSIDPANAWGWKEHLLADIANRLRWLQWAKTTDGAKNRNRPELIQVPKREIKKPPVNPTYTAEEYAKRLALARNNSLSQGDFI